MIRTGVNFLISCLAALLFFGCHDLGEEVPGGGEWAIYRLRDTTLTNYAVRGQAISTLVLAPAPFITARDIKAYHWKNHAIEFTWQTEAMMDSFAMPHRGSTAGRPFVVTVGTERIYLGTFWWGYSSSMPVCPYILVDSYGTHRIELPPLFEGTDPRGDQRVFRALKRAGILVEE